MVYGRRKVVSCIGKLMAILLSIFCIGCKDTLPPIKQIQVYKDFSVNYIDVGQGDCIFIRLPDGKNLLIDSGLNDSQNENLEYITKIFNKYSVEKIDYFVLTHPDIDHIGNAKEIINKFDVGTIYLPLVSNVLIENFESFKELLDLVEVKQIEKVISDYLCYIVGNDYCFAFLSPLPIDVSGSSYAQLESSLYPTDRQVNDLSPIIYFECFDKRFVFTGDASSSQESIVLDNYNIGIYQVIFQNKGIEVNLQNVDYLKVSHHGADGASSTDFLSLLKPKNFIISVGKENFYGHPRSEVLERILTICPESKIYRTDEVGTVTIHKNQHDQVVISTTK